MTSPSPSPPTDPASEAERLLQEYWDLERAAEAKLRELEAAFRKIGRPLPLFPDIDKQHPEGR